MTWESCRIGSCHRHQKCMYTPCRTSPDAQARLMAFAIGDEVAVLPDAGDWASDWQDVQLWIAGVHAVPGGGFEYWVSDIWPLPGKPALTDGFYMDVEGESNTLSLVSRTPDAQPSSDWWQRFCTIMDKTDDEGFSPEIEQELMELHAGIQPSSTEGEVERLRSALELFIEQAVFDEYTHRVSVDEFVLSKARAAIAAQVTKP